VIINIKLELRFKLNKVKVDHFLIVRIFLGFMGFSSDSCFFLSAVSKGLKLSGSNSTSSSLASFLLSLPFY
jgi:hypothetical protein